MPPTEHELAVRSQRGDLDAYGELVRLHQGAVFSVCYRLLGERGDAEDASQETFIRAYERLQLFDPQRPFGPWVRRVAANLCINRMQALKDHGLPFEDELENRHVPSQPSPEALAEKNEESMRIWMAIMDLPPHYRAVIELRHFQDLSYDEIAHALEIPVGVVKTHLHRARKILSKGLQPDDE
jgi:RNA polymerase sigma-70 factor (ECF subfamily)